MFNKSWIIFQIGEVGAGQPFCYGYHKLIKINRNTLEIIDYHPCTPAHMIQAIKADIGRKLSPCEATSLYSNNEFLEANEVLADYSRALNKRYYGV